MKAITLTQPWATLVAIGAKRIETRSWCVAYRGPLAIHAAKGLGPVGGVNGLRWQCSQEPFCSVLNDWAKKHAETCTNPADMINRPLLPLGCIVATCELYYVRRTQGVTIESDYGLSALELAFGDYAPSRYAWLLRDIKMLQQPIPATGALGLWEWVQP